MLKKSLFVLIVGIVVVACNTENPFISKELADQLLKSNNVKTVEYVAAILDDDIYWIRNFDGKPRKINTGIAGSKSQVRISHDHRRISFFDETGDLYITDTLGAVIDSYEIPFNVQSADWTADDKAIWLLADNAFYLAGEEMELPDIEKDPEEEVISATVTPDNDILYIVRRTGFNGSTERLEIRGLDGSSRTITKQAGEIRKMETVRLSKDGEHFIIGYVTAVGYADLVKLEVYALDGNSPIYTMETARYFEPIYDADSEFIVTGMSSPSSFDNEFSLAALYLKNEATGESKDIYKPEYSANLGYIYVDWK